MIPLIQIYKLILEELQDEATLSRHAEKERMAERDIPLDKIKDVLKRGKKVSDWREEPGVVKFVKDGIEVVMNKRTGKVMTVKRLPTEQDIQQHMDRFNKLTAPRPQPKRYDPIMPSRFRGRKIPKDYKP